MKRILFPILFITTVITTAAQPKDAWKATATLTAYDAAGTQIYSGAVFFIDDKGTIVAPYSPFTRAVRAEITDVKGRRHAVQRIFGASENYGFVRLSTAATGTDFLRPIADSTQTARVGSKLYLVGYLRTKKETPVAATVNKAERYDAAMFYATTLPGEDKYVGCPLIDASGRVLAVVGQHAGEALDIRFATAPQITANSALDRELHALPMPKAIPQDPDEAGKYITLLDAIDPAAALIAMDDYVAAYPEEPVTYLTRAVRLAQQKQYDRADTDFRQALALANPATTAEAVHYSYSRSIYNAAQSDSLAARHGWTLQRALQEAEAAQTTPPQPLYQLQQANCLYALERYAEAYDKYMEVNATSFATDETFFTAMLALERADGDTAQILALLDKAIALQTRPYTQRAATYFFERAQRLVSYGQYRRAVGDFNEFERIIGPRNLNDNFYFMREQAELQAHMYQQALDDIQSAILSAPAQRKPYYQTEEALIYLTCGEYQSALASGQAALAQLPDHLPLLRILGAASGESGDKAKAREYLLKAQSLGDTGVDRLLEKYK